MKFVFAHNNINVFDLDKSLTFYEKALQMKVARRYDEPTGAFTLVYLETPDSAHQLELTWLRDRKEPYNLGDNEIHLAFHVDDFEAAHQLHKDMGCIIFENEGMGIYFIADPDGYWNEIIPAH